MKCFLKYIIPVVLVVAVLGVVTRTGNGMAANEANPDLRDEMPQDLPVASFAGGCFWCLESEFRPLEGVVYTRAGYEGGDLEEPSYQDITTGKTGHAETVEIYFDPAKTGYRELVHYFLTKAHDPTQLNRQGVDEGPQYRSVIFYHDGGQKKIAEDEIAALTAAKNFKKPIVTKVEPARTFWEGEDYHQQYYEKYEENTGKAHPRVIYKKLKKKSNNN